MQNMSIVLPPSTIIRDDSGVERVYKSKNKSSVSVNKILGYCEDKTYLHQWRKKVGNEKAQEISNKASKDGSKVHLANEGHFTGEVVEFENNRQKQIHEQFKKFLSIVDEPIAHEYPVFWTSQLDMAGLKNIETGKECSVGGTFDAFLKINFEKLIDSKTRQALPLSECENNYLIVDYKTQSKKKDVRWMLKHYVQAAAYIGALNQMTDNQYKICQAMIVGATSRGLYLYYLDSRRISWYWRNWLKMVASYFYGNKFDWTSFKNYSEGYTLLEDGKTWEYEGLHKSFLPIEVEIV